MAGICCRRHTLLAGICCRGIHAAWRLPRPTRSHSHIQAHIHKKQAPAEAEGGLRRVIARAGSRTLAVEEACRWCAVRDVAREATAMACACGSACAQALRARTRGFASHHTYALGQETPLYAMCKHGVDEQRGRGGRAGWRMREAR